MDEDPRDAIRDARSRRCETCGWLLEGSDDSVIYSHPSGQICGACFHREAMKADRRWRGKYNPEESVGEADLNDPGIREW